MAALRVNCDKRPAFKIHPFKGFGAQLNTNIFRPVGIFPDPERAAKDQPNNPDQEGQPRALTPGQRTKLRNTIVNLQPGHSRVFVGRVLVATPKPPPRELKAFLDTLSLAEKAGANVNLTFWGQGPYAGRAQLRQLSWPQPSLSACRLSWSSKGSSSGPRRFSTMEG